MQLLTSEEGWAATDHRLFWTSDGGGQWNKITPRAAPSAGIVSVFFLDDLHGWILLSGDGSNGEALFNVAVTYDAGRTWSIMAVTIPGLDFETTTLVGGVGDIDFVDSVHGWMNLPILSSSNFRRGITVKTEDGGREWSQLANDAGVAGSIRFINDRDGWLAGGPADQDLYVTRDSGNTWQRVSLEAPSQTYPAVFPTYSVPIFEDAKHDFLPVTYSGLDTKGALVLFTTTDSGKTWAVDTIVHALEFLSPGQRVQSTVADSAFVTAAPSNLKGLDTNRCQGRKQNRCDCRRVFGRFGCYEAELCRQHPRLDSDQCWAIAIHS